MSDNKHDWTAVELQRIEFGEATGSPPSRVAIATYRIRTHGAEDITLSVWVDVANDATDVVQLCGDALHRITARIATNTEKWALPPAG